MTEAAKQPSTATRSTGGQPTTNGHGPRGDQDLRSEQDLVGDRDRDDGNDRDERAERNSDDEQRDQRQRGEQWHGDRGDLSDGREPGREPGGVQRTLAQMTDRATSATFKPGDAFATTPDMSKILTAWFDMAGEMMKLQQQFFNTVLSAGNTNDRNTTKI